MRGPPRDFPAGGGPALLDADEGEGADQGGAGADGGLGAIGRHDSVRF